MSNYKVHQLTSANTAKRVIDFLLSKDAFDMEWAPGEKDIVRKSVLDCLPIKNHVYWYIEDEGKIIGAIGIQENAYKSGGFEATSDYFAVHQAYHRKGIGTLLLSTVEKYVKEHRGRYILVATCDTDVFAPARAFYEKHGFKQIGYIPDYYKPGEGKVDYYKKIDNDSDSST